MPWARCRNCGCFREPVRDADLFDAPLPMPAVGDGFAAFHRQSQQRERDAAARGADRQVGQIEGASAGVVARLSTLQPSVPSPAPAQD